MLERKGKEEIQMQGKERQEEGTLAEVHQGKLAVDSAVHQRSTFQEDRESATLVWHQQQQPET